MKYYPFELHTHTKHSDGVFSVEQLVEYAKMRGLTGIAKTDHNTANGNDNFAELCREASIVPIEGFEITNCEQGDATVLGGVAAKGIEMFGKYDSESFQFIAETVKAGGGSIGYSHPYRYLPGPKTLGNYDEASGEEKIETTHIEVWNGPNIERRAARKDATRLYLQILRKRPLAAIASTDFHVPTVLGCYYSLTYIGMDGIPNSDKAINAILNRNTYIAYGWKINDEDPLLQLIGKSLSPGHFEFDFTMDRLLPPLVGSYDSAVVPHEVHIIACENEGHSIIGVGKFEFGGDGESAKACFSFDLKPVARIVLQVLGSADGIKTPLLTTSPIEVEPSGQT